MRYREEDVIRSEVRLMLTQVFTSIPAIVESYNSKKQTVNVIVATETPLFGDENLPPHRLEEVPVIFPSGSNWVIAGPLKKGDAVYLLCPHHGIEEYLQGNKGEVGASKIPTYHDINECVAITGMFTFNSPTRKEAYKDLFHIAEDENAIVFDLNNGILATSNTKVIVKAGSTVVNINADGTVTIDATTVNVNANLEVTGDINATGTVTGDTDVVSGAISLKTHTHGGVQGGSSSTGVPE
jgi:hypothetical protein